MIRKKKHEKKFNKKFSRNNKKEEEISEPSSDDDSFNQSSQGKSASEGEEGVIEEETVEQKRIRLAKEYLSKLRKEAKENEELSDEDEYISKQLKLNENKKEGNKKIADKIEIPEKNILRCVSSITGSKYITDIAVTKDFKRVYTVDKNGKLTLFDIETQKKINCNWKRDLRKLLNKRMNNATWVKRNNYGINPRTLHSVAITHDEKYLITAGCDNHIHIIDTKSYQTIKSIEGHMGAITGITFPQESYEFFTSSFDKTIKKWSLEHFRCIDTYFGHNNEINAIDSYAPYFLASCGNDATCRYWKTQSDSQLIFRTKTMSTECIKMINKEIMVTGCKNGIYLWNVSNKKPIYRALNAHSKYQNKNINEMSNIQSITSCSKSDLIMSGAADGYLRLWKLVYESNDNIIGLNRMPLKLKLHGFINSSKINDDGNLVIAAAAKEPRLNKFAYDNRCSNGIHIFKLKHS